MPDSDDNFPCINEDFGFECEYPFCNCEDEYYNDKVEDLIELFGHEEWPEDYDGEWNEE